MAKRSFRACFLQFHVMAGREAPPELVRRTQEGCGGLGGENPAAFPKAQPIFQQPFCLPESAQTSAGIAFRAAGKSVRNFGFNFPAASKFARKLFQQGISGSHSLLESSELAVLNQGALNNAKENSVAYIFRRPIPREFSVNLFLAINSSLTDQNMRKTCD